MRELWTYLHTPPNTALQAACVLLYLLAWLPFVVKFVTRLVAWVTSLHVDRVTEWIAAAPMTNLRLLVGIILGVVFVLGTMLASVIGIDLTDNIGIYLGGFILLLQGIDVAQFGIKRKTFDPTTVGMTRESIGPGPATPAADIVQATGQPVPTPAPAAPNPTPSVMAEPPSATPLAPPATVEPLAARGKGTANAPGDVPGEGG